MADSGTIYEALVQVNVADNDAPGQLAAIIQRLNATMQGLQMPAVDVGANFGSSLATIDAQIGALKAALGSVNAEMEGLARVSGSSNNPFMASALGQYRDMAAELQAVINKTVELRAVQQQAVGNGRRPVDPIAKLEGEASAASAAYREPAPKPAPAPDESSRGGANPGARDWEALAQQLRNSGFEAKRLQDALTSLSVPIEEARRIAGTEKPEKPKFAGAEAEDEVRARIETATPEGGHTAVEAAQARYVTATERLNVALEADYTSESRRAAAVAQGIAGFVAADRSLEKAKEDEKKAHEKAAAAAAKPVLNIDTSGIDKTASVNVQTRQLAVAEAEAKEKAVRQAIIGNGTAGDIEKARLATLRAQQALAIETQKEVDASRKRTFFTGLTQSYSANRGAAAPGAAQPGFGAGLGEEAGFALKYYAFYQIFSIAQQTMAGIKTATEEYTLSVNELSVALGVNYDKASLVAGTYADIGSSLATAPSVAISGGAKFARTFRNDDGSPSADAGTVGARITSQINVLEGVDKLDNTIESLIAVTKAYGVGASGAQNVYDRATQIGQYYGYTTGGELLPGAGQIADIGAASGYSQDQLLALVASTMQGTGLTSDAVAGDIKRVLGADQKPLDSTLSALGVNSVDLNFAQKMDELSKAITHMPKEQADALLQGLGGSRSGATFYSAAMAVPTAKQAEEISKDLPTAAQAADKQLRTLGGAMKQLSADMQGLYTAMASGGLGTAFAEVVGWIHNLITGMTGIVSGFEEMDKWVKITVPSLLALAAAIKFLPAGALPGFLGGTLGSGGAAAGGAVARGQVAAQLARAGGTAVAGAETAAVAGGLGSLAASAGAAAAALAPLVLIIAALATAGAAYNAGKAAENGATDAAGSIGEGHKATAANDPERMRAEAKRQEDDAKAIASSGDGFGGHVLYGINDGIAKLTGNDTLSSKRDDVVEKLRANAAALKAQADKVSDEQVRVAHQLAAGMKGGDSAAFFGQHYQDVSGGVDKILAQGAGVDTETDLMKDLFKNGAGNALQLKQILQPDSGKKGVADLITDIQSRISKDNSPFSRLGDLDRLRRAEEQALQIVKDNGGTGAQIDAMSQILRDGNKAFNDQLVSNVQGQIAAFKASNPKNNKSVQHVKSMLEDAIRAVAPTGDVDNLITLMNGANAGFLASVRRNIEAMISTLKAQIAAIQKAAAATLALETGGPGIPNGSYNQRVVGGIIENGLGVDKKQTELDRQMKALDTFDQAKQLTSQGGDSFKWPNEKAPKKGPTAEDIEIARLQAQERPGDPVSAAQVQINVARYQLAHAGNDRQKYYQALKALHDAEFAYSQAIADASVAEAQLAAIPGDPISQASANLRAAQIALGAAVKGTADYYSKLKSLNDSKYEMAKAELDKANNVALLGIDMTDPVAMAQEKVRQAVRQRNFDRGRGAATTADDVAVRQATSDAQKAAFDQQFGDQRTNFDLNRISLQAYMSYLQSQHNYLSAVKNKTRQQVDELNQVDQALKSLTDSMDGQFNLGQIKVPTPYEVRRTQAAGAGPTVSGAPVTITINGTDLQAVRGVIAEYVGQGVMQRTGTSVRKV